MADATTVKGAPGIDQAIFNMPNVHDLEPFDPDAFVEALFEKENAERQQIASGMSIDEVYRKYGVL